MTLRLGGEFELKDVDIKTSTIETRKLFLELIWEMTPEAVVDLMRLFNIESIPEDWREVPKQIDFSAKFFLLHTQRNYLYSADLTEFSFKSDVRQTPVLAYFDFIFKNQAEFDELLEKSEKFWKEFTPDNYYTDLITRRAIEELIPNWQTLQSKNGSEWLCSELSQWAEKWNLKDDWCLDFALDCLMNFKIGLVDKYPLPDDYFQTDDLFSLWELNKFWHNGKAWAFSLRDFDDQYFDNLLAVSKIKDYPSLQYIWTENSKEIFKVEDIYNPLITSPAEFREQVEKQFWSKFFEYFSGRQYSFVGNSKLLTDELKKIQNRVRTHISKAEAKMKPFAQRTVKKRSGDLHFRWLVEYQVLGKSFNTLAKEKGVDRRAIMDGIKDVSKIIGLTLREPTKHGRKQGAKDSVKRQERRSSNS